MLGSYTLMLNWSSKEKRETLRQRTSQPAHVCPRAILTLPFCCHHYGHTLLPQYLNVAGFGRHKPCVMQPWKQAPSPEAWWFLFFLVDFRVLNWMLFMHPAQPYVCLCHPYCFFLHFLWCSKSEMSMLLWLKCPLTLVFTFCVLVLMAAFCQQLIWRDYPDSRHGI